VFDPTLKQNNTWNRLNEPGAAFDPLDPTRSFFTSTPTDAYRSEVGLSKTNVLGGAWTLNWVENPTRFATPTVFPLNPQNPNNVELS
jgi:hypothetical protein